MGEGEGEGMGGGNGGKHPECMHRLESHQVLYSQFAIMETLIKRGYTPLVITPKQPDKSLSKTYLVVIHVCVVIANKIPSFETASDM